MSVWRTILSDLNRYYYSSDINIFDLGKLSLLQRIAKLMIFQGGFRAVVLYRLINRVHHRSRFLWLPFRLLQLMTVGIEISPTAGIGPGLFIPHAQCIVIGPDAIIGRDVTIYQGVTIGYNAGKFTESRKCVTIGDRVMIGAGAIILGPVTIGHNTVVGAAAVVTRDIPENCVVTGIPAQVIGTIDEPYPDLLFREIRHMSNNENRTSSLRQK